MYCLSSCHQQLEQLLWKFCAFYEKVKQESWSGGPCHFVCPNLAYFHQVSLKRFLFSPQCLSSAPWASPSLPDAPSDTSCWHLDWTLMIPSSRVFMLRLRGKSMARRNNNTQRWNISGTKSAAQWFEKYAKICKTAQKKNPSILKNETAGTKPCLAIWESWNLL